MYGAAGLTIVSHPALGLASGAEGYGDRVRATTTSPSAVRAFRLGLWHRLKHMKMHATQRPTDADIAEMRRRRPGVRASLACENIYLTVAEKALLDQFEQERLPPDEAAARITEYCRAQRRQKADAAE